MPMLRNNIFYCDHLGASERDSQDVLDFSVGDRRGEGLVSYLQQFALQDEQEGNMRTYLVRENRSAELVGYFSLKAGLVSFNEQSSGNEAGFDTLPGVEIANFAINERYIRRNPNSKGVGLSLFNDFIVPVIEDVSRQIGVKFIYLFALPFEGLIQRYGQYGFMRFEAARESEIHKRLKPRYDSECIFMYQML